MMILAKLMKFGLFLIAVVFWPSKIYFKLKSRKYCPPIRNQILTSRVSELAEKIRKKELSSEEVVNAFISRVKEVNPVLNAVVQERFEQALKEAKEVDKYLSSSTKNVSSFQEDLKKNKPYLGIPFTVKESIPVKGMSNNAGSAMYQRFNVEEDDDMVKFMKEAGGIPILVSNTPEMCMNWETSNKVTGRTLNPYDTRKTCGGSSGGEAVLLASGASLIGFGSDLCGSLRVPGHYCGIFGHKPTPKIINFKKHFPNCESEIMWPDVFTLGPMSRYATDLPLLLNTICTNEEKTKLKLTEKVDLKSIKFYYMTETGDPLTDKVDQEIVDKIEAFVNYLKTNHGIQATKLNLKEMSYAPLSMASFIKIDGTTPTIGEGNSGCLEFIKFIFGCSKCTIMPVLFGAFYPLMRKMASESYIDRVDKPLDKLRTKLLDILGDDGVFLFPSFPKAAHYHTEIYYNVLNVSYMTVFNVCKVPVTNCPLGLNSEGMPVGVQVASAQYNDRLTMRVAEEIELAMGGWKPPPSNSTN